MKPFTSHSRDEESLEAKARWSQSLSVEERMEIFYEWCEMALAVDPDLLKRKKRWPHAKSVLVLSLDSEAKDDRSFSTDDGDPT